VLTYAVSVVALTASVNSVSNKSTTCQSLFAIKWYKNNINKKLVG